MYIRNFPIPDLPATMLNDVLKKLRTEELIYYSTTSESCKNNVKSMLTRRKVKLGISVGRPSLFFDQSFPETDNRAFTISIDRIRKDSCEHESRKSKTEKMMNFNGKIVSTVVKKREELVVNWENEIDGLIFMLNYLAELFPNMTIFHLKTGSWNTEYTKTVIEWIKKREKPEVETCEVTSVSTEDVSNLLDNVAITKALEIVMSLPDDFKCDLPQNLKKLECSFATWISRDQLLRMNHEQILIRATKFQNRDISDLVNKIMNGDLPAIRFCSIDQLSLKMDEIVNGINYDKIPSQLKCQIRLQKYGGGQFNVNGVYDYERADGKTISVCSGYHIAFPNYNQIVKIFVWSRTEPLSELLEI